MTEVRSQKYLNLFRTRWRAVAAGLLLGILVAVGIVLVSPREYAAKVTIFVSAATADASALEGSQLSAQRIQTYIQLLTSNKIANDVVSNLNLGMTGAELAERITASTQPDTVLLTATVTDEDPVRATEIANVLADQFAANVGLLERAADDSKSPLITAKVFEPAVPPVQPVSPRPGLTLAIGALLGLLTGVGLAALRQTLDRSITTQQRLTEIVDAPVLGVITRDRRSRKQPLVMRDDPRTPGAEAFRRLRANLQFADVDHAHKVILVTSASPGEGKTTVLCNLACALADAGRDVLVIEADLRHPRAADFLGIERTVGLANVLVDRTRVEDVVVRWNEVLDVVPSGPLPPNPGELLGSQEMAALLADVRARYDVILIDASPLLPVADALPLAALADGVVLVVRHGASMKDVHAAREALAAMSVRLLGAVMTMVPGRAARGDRRYGAPDAVHPETSVPETSVPETSVPETSVPETSVPETSVPKAASPPR